MIRIRYIIARWRTSAHSSVRYDLMEPIAGPIVILGTASASLAGWVCYEHHRWQARIERERFVLALKAAATPDQLRPDERARLRLLRAPWWAIWRWLPEQLS